MILATIAAVVALVPQAATKLVVVSWDGTPDWVVDRLLEEGKLPNVARIAAAGVRSRSVVPAFPSKTAVGHAAIFTGTWGDVNGVTNNSVPLLPRLEHTILETRSGFDSRSLLAEPIYDSLAIQGWKVAVLSATQAYPPEPHLARLKQANVPPDHYIQFSGFESEIAPAQMVTASRFDSATVTWPNAPQLTGPSKSFTFKAGDVTFYGLAFDDPADPVHGLDTVLIRKGSLQAAGKDQVRLKPAEAREDSAFWSPAMRITGEGKQANTSLRLFSLKPDGSSMELYVRKASALPGAHTPAQEDRYLGAYPGFHDDAFGNYKRGMFGKPIFDGGDGTAEKRILEIVKSDCDYLVAGTKFAIKEWNPDAIFHYTPMSDSAGHTWMGYLDPDVDAVDPKVRAFLWTCYEKVFEYQDAWMGEILKSVPQDCVVALVSDHGMQGVTAYANVNAILAEAGLVTIGSDGRMDLTRTQVCAPPWADFGLVVNTTDWKGGIVPLDQKQQVLAKAEAALLAARTSTGGAIVTSVLRSDQNKGLGLGGPTGPDAFLDFAAGFYPSSRQANRTVSPMPSPEGVHGFLPYRARMHTVFFARGRGLKIGAMIPAMRQIDEMPTICAALGIKPPAQATGIAVAQALRVR